MDVIKLKELTESAKQAATVGAQILTHYAGESFLEKVKKKQAFDFVTEVDLESERAIIEFLKSHHPTHSIFAEESHKQEATQDYRWIIDPLDGTTNFIHKYPVFSVSIACEYKGEIIAAAICDPMRKELFHAAKGAGAFRNETPISVSPITEKASAIFSTGFPFRQKQILDSYLRMFADIFQYVSGVRRQGSAALDLAYVACGRCEAFWELGLSPWDIAAGSLIVEEAGGKCTSMKGADDYIWTGDVIASNGHFHDFLVKAASKHVSELL